MFPHLIRHTRFELCNFVYAQLYQCVIDSIYMRTIVSAGSNPPCGEQRSMAYRKYTPKVIFRLFPRFDHSFLRFRIRVRE